MRLQAELDDFGARNRFPEAEKERLRQLLKSVRNEGLFTPPSLEGSIELPGHNGGANWGSTAVDPTKGELYVVAKNMPTLMRLVLSNEEPTAGGALAGGGQSPITTAEQKAQLLRGRHRIDHPDTLRPTRPVLHSGPMEIAGRTLDVRVAPFAATEADLWIYDPEMKLAIVGDLVVDLVPFMDTACLDGCRAALD